MNKPSILAVGLDDETRKSVGLTFCGIYEVKYVDTVEAASKELISNSFDFLIADIGSSSGDMTKISAILKEKEINYTRLIILSSLDSAKNAVFAIKSGADDYIVKPLDPTLLLKRIEKFADELRIKKELDFFRSELRGRIGDNFYFTQNAVMKNIYSVVAQVARSSSSVLITGENGTGKEVIARSLHYGSARKERPFVAINCAAIPSELMESEFFGHEKGSFTGANAAKIGRLEFADGGTVFLDEISTLPMQLQAKLLRVIQEKTFERVGSNKQIIVDVRFIAATNANLHEDIRAGNFREDLYYRLNVVPIHVAPLRERKEDIPGLADFFVKKHASIAGRKVVGLSPSALESLMLYDWPGNIRELQNIIERVVVLSKDKTIIEKRDLPYEILHYKNAYSVDKAKEYDSLKQVCSEFERDVIVSALERCGWNCSSTSRRLRIHRNTLLKKMKEYGIVNPRRDSNDGDDFYLHRQPSYDKN